ncbi:TetR/AcrR family transcriptional regulator [Ktedonospora formicarum]|uniref:TetR family transcriptional regulator n=1 Tax=Ktedonospora formicarum TaxID=2778364 RepID=A0A8J3ICZ4_9CHLR|nr:TetR/AcrR family transcriptional regulator [Ktedonospora formicarum]GHO50467.1 TetR family transcriptional regulator [Ktedonospora formicarum]
MATPPKSVDRRVRRTQQMLKQAFVEAVREKGFAETSVQEIAERANVNRGTFYSHFPDKYALLDLVVHEQFQIYLANTLPPIPSKDPSFVHLLIEKVLIYFAEMKEGCHPMDLVIARAQQAAHEELTRLLRAWLTLNIQPGIHPRVPLDTIAQTMSQAILGAAIWQSEGTRPRPAAQAASDILLILMEGVTQASK